MNDRLDPHINPWKTTESQTIYQNAWITVREHQVIRPDGKPGIYGVVETRVATAVVALTPEHEVYLVGQYRYPTDAYSWELIEGGTNSGEDPLAAAQRELEEEAGLVAGSWRLIMDAIQMSNCISNEMGVVFLAQDLRETSPNPDGTEQLQVKRVPFEEAIAMIDRGEITDSLSIIGLLMAERHLRGDA